MFAAPAVGRETYEILDGVRRAKAAQLTGQVVVRARIDDGSGALGPVVDLAIDDLRSPKPDIDVSTTASSRDSRTRWTRHARARRRRQLLSSAVIEGGPSSMLDSSSDNVRSARALHRVLVKARHLALNHSAGDQLVGILDWAEVLAADMAEDRTRDFGEHLQGLGDDHPELAGVARDFKDGRL